MKYLINNLNPHEMKIANTIVFCLLFSFGLSAQLHIGKLFIKKVGISTGFDQDRINNLDLDFMLGTALGGERSQFTNANLPASDLIGGTCENPYLRAFVTLGAPGLQNTFLDLAVVGVFNRYDGLYYDSNTDFFQNWNEGYDYVSVNSFSDEVMLEAMLSQQVNVASWFKLYGSLGTNLGYTMNNQIIVDGHLERNDVENNQNRSPGEVYSGYYYEGNTNETYQGKNAFSQRVFAEIGTGLILWKRFETGLFFRRGVGYRAYQDFGTRGVQLHSFGLRMNWIISK